MPTITSYKERFVKPFTTNILEHISNFVKIYSKLLIMHAWKQAISTAFDKHLQGTNSKWFS